MKEQKPTPEYMEKYNLKNEWVVRGKFLWFPKIIDGRIRWLKKAYWFEERFQYHDFNVVSFILNPFRVGNYDTRWSEWRPIKWID